MNKQTKALKMAIEAMENSLVYCEDLHHAKKDLHKYSDPCPVEQRWNATIQACKEALAQPASKNIRDSFNEMLEDKVAYYKSKQPAQEPVAWISVKDKLPDVGVEVLTYDTHHEKKYFLNSIIIDKVDKFYFNGFTHWMPLPSAPNEIYTNSAPSDKCEECGMKYCECGERK